MYDIILFDLDGTLTDPKEGIINSVYYALQKLNIEVLDKEELKTFIGPPLIDSFMKEYNLTEEEGNKAISYYREYFKEKGIYENKLYDNIIELLENLKKRDKRLLVATSKPEYFTNIILKYFNLDKYFDFVAGASMDNSRIKKADIIKYGLDSCGIKDKSKVIMIGDRKHDIIGANINEIDSIGVLYGYGAALEFIENNATYIVNKPLDILDII